MLLKTLRIRNIRSYRDEEITFPEGIVLLAGDIGSGKSTILLAIEFALFGLLRGELSGSALLRNGANEGSVELTFALNGREYAIGRALKRTKTSVEQDAGYIIEGGLRREATAVELKAFVLSLLGYPADLLTKSKSLIYRYTVYTPQEEMKRIILDDSEERLNILRKVFDIDKYKRIAENARVYAKELRRQKSNCEAQLADEPLKKQQLQEKKQQAADLQKKLLDVQPRLQAARQAVQQQKTALDALESERATLAAQRASFEAAEAELRTLKQHNQHFQSELSQLSALKEAPAPAASAADLAESLQKLQRDLQDNEQSIRRLIAARAELDATRRQCDTTINAFRMLDQCPTCRQQVDATHKHGIIDTEQRKADALLAHIAEHERNLRRHEQIKTRITADILATQQQQASLREAQMAHEHYKQQFSRKQQAETRLAQLAQSIQDAETRRQQAAGSISAWSALETRYSAEKTRLEALRENEKTVSLEHEKHIMQAKFLREIITGLETDIKAKESVRARLQKLSALDHWVGGFFTNLMDVMERHVLTKVYHEFNGLFAAWFALLIEDEVLSARLDEHFSPVMQQNGYDTEVQNLSGGEKTACALAYRLALNKVINDLHSGITTKSLLILDEPTDGFSADQLSRMRDVLDQVKARQVILVSHEALIESMADHVLRVVKEEHASRVIV
jgi:exonuclease SbcC